MNEKVLVFPDKIQERALETWRHSDHPSHYDPIRVVLGITGEAGEVADQLKKHLFRDGYVVTHEEFVDELGDLLYYVAIRAYQLGIPLDELSRRNREKLGGRKEYQNIGRQSA